VYAGRGAGIELFERMVSRRHFEKIKAIFDVTTIDQLKALIVQSTARNKDNQMQYYGMWNYGIGRVEHVIDVQRLGTIR
jgi:hypothetical protein